MDSAPNSPLDFFLRISRIPRPSGEEKAVSDHILSLLKNRSLWVEQDRYNNLYIKKPGAGKGSGAKPVILQAHLDMVCEKEAGRDFDFHTQGIEMVWEGDWLSAKGTTLGADDGFGLAYILALLYREDGDCPPLECLLTTEEETGLTGALNAGLSEFCGKRLINLDGKPEGSFVVGSAGGLTTRFSRPLARSSGRGTAYTLSLGGLQGGHSGRVIDRELGNAIKLAVRALCDLSRNSSLRLISLAGGDKDNAIPRECGARFLMEGDFPGGLAPAAWAASWETRIKAELEDRAPRFFLSLKEEEAEEYSMSEEDTRNLLWFLRIIPDGPVHRNPALNGLVINSANLASVSAEATQALATVSLRSSLQTLLEELAGQEEIIARLCGFSCQHGAAYPSWAYEEHSPLRETCIEVYRKCYRQEPKVLALHVGLECGVFKEKRPDLDIISLGPDVEGIHSPLERMNIPSFLRTYGFLEEVLAALCLS
jgi:dipeptidase D